MVDADNIGIAYFERKGKQLHSADGWQGDLDAAVVHVQDMLDRAIYDGAAEARIYRGRTSALGEVLKVVKRQDQIRGVSDS